MKEKYKEKCVQTNLGRRRTPALSFDALGNDHGREALFEFQALFKFENEPEEGHVSVDTQQGGGGGKWTHFFVAMSAW